MSLKIASLLGLATAATLAATSAIAGNVALSDGLLATQIKQAQNRTTIAAQIEKAKEWGVGPVMAVKLERVQLKQAQNRRQLAAQLERSYELGVSPVMAAQLDKIHAKQHQMRHELADKVGPDALPFDPSPMGQDFGG